MDVPYSTQKCRHRPPRRGFRLIPGAVAPFSAARAGRGEEERQRRGPTRASREQNEQDGSPPQAAEPAPHSHCPSCPRQRRRRSRGRFCCNAAVEAAAEAAAEPMRKRRSPEASRFSHSKSRADSSIGAYRVSSSLTPLRPTAKDSNAPRVKSRPARRERPSLFLPA